MHTLGLATKITWL